MIIKFEIRGYKMMCKRAEVLSRLAAIGGKIGIKYLCKLREHFRNCKVCRDIGLENMLIIDSDKYTKEKVGE